MADPEIGQVVDQRGCVVEAELGPQLHPIGGHERPRPTFRRAAINGRLPDQGLRSAEGSGDQVRVGVRTSHCEVDAVVHEVLGMTVALGEPVDEADVGMRCCGLGEPLVHELLPRPVDAGIDQEHPVPGPDLGEQLVEPPVRHGAVRSEVHDKCLTEIAGCLECLQRCDGAVYHWRLTAALT